MTPAQIEGMIDRICGIYPTSNIYRKGMRSTWSLDDFMLSVDVEDGRKVLQFVEMHGKIPSLPEMKQMFRAMWNKQPTNERVQIKCEVCAETGWDDGIRMERDSTAVYGWKMVQGLSTEQFQGNTYTVVRPCACPHGQERAAALRQLDRN